MANFPNLKTIGASVEINRETAFLNKMIKSLSQEGWDLRRLLAASPCGLCTPPRIQDFYNYAWFKYYFAITLNVCLSHELKGERNMQIWIVQLQSFLKRTSTLMLTNNHFIGVWKMQTLVLFILIEYQHSTNTIWKAKA